MGSPTKTLYQDIVKDYIGVVKKSKELYLNAMQSNASIIEDIKKKWIIQNIWFYPTAIQFWPHGVSWPWRCFL